MAQFLIAGLLFTIAGSSSSAPLPPVQSKVVASDGAPQDFFGDSVALDGQTLVVGASLADVAYSDAGAVYVYLRDTNGWTQQQKIVNQDASSGYLFGTAVAISKDTLVAGSPMNFVGRTSLGGAAYVYTRTQGQWTLQQKLTAAAPFDNDGFGYTLSIDGDTIVVGAANDVQNGMPSGTAYVFVRQGASWSLQQILTASDAAPFGTFGTSTVVSSNTIVVGAIGDGVMPGSAYVFQRSGTTWAEVQRLAPSDGNSDDGFGLVSGLSGNTVVIGAPRDSNRGYQMGSAYVFTRNGSVWTSQQKLEDLNGKELDQFGHAVAISGERLVVGSVSADGLVNPDTGSGDLFVRSNGVWTLDQRLTADDLQPHDVFGHSVAMTSSKIAIGALRYFNFNPGAVYTYETEEPAPPAPPADTEAPVISTVCATPNLLSPPNHRMVPVTIQVNATDNTAVVGSRVVNVSCNQPNTSAAPDWVITGDLTLDVRAERSGGEARIYTITVECTDAAGNASRAAVAVKVPKGNDDVPPPVIKLIKRLEKRESLERRER